MDDQIKLTPLNPDDVALHWQHIQEIYGKDIVKERIAYEQAMGVFFNTFDTQKRFS